MHSSASTVHGPSSRTGRHRTGSFQFPKNATERPVLRPSSAFRNSLTWLTRAYQGPSRLDLTRGAPVAATKSCLPATTARTALVPARVAAAARVRPVAYASSRWEREATQDARRSTDSVDAFSRHDGARSLVLACFATRKLFPALTGRREGAHFIRKSKTESQDTFACDSHSSKPTGGANTGYRILLASAEMIMKYYAPI